MPKFRRRIFVGCEGSGERSLTIALQKFAEDEKLPIHLHPYDAHGGSPLEVLRKSIREAADKARTRGAFDGGVFVLVDQDRIISDGCDETMILQARRSKIRLVRQNTKLECLLGRMISGDFSLGETRAIAELKRAWPDYEKGFDATSLKTRISVARIRESVILGEEWCGFLQSIGLVEKKRK